MNSKLTATAGEHFVVYMLSRLGYIAAVVREGAQSIDILASTTDGSNTVGIQVKTTSWAERTRGRGAAKVLAELQFPLGHHAVEVSDRIVFRFVDLRGDNLEAVPDVYVVPAKIIKQDYAGVDVRQWSFFRLHRPIEWMAPYKNNWKPVQKALSRTAAA